MSDNRTLIQDRTAPYIEVIVSYFEWFNTFMLEIVDKSPKITRKHAQELISRNFNKRIIVEIMKDVEGFDFPFWKTLHDILVQINLEEKSLRHFREIVNQYTISLSQDPMKKKGRIVGIQELRLQQLHDFFVALISEVGSDVGGITDRIFTRDALNYSISRCSFFPLWWEEVVNVSTSQLVVLIQEEFRLHFSGENRTGRTDVIISEHGAEVSLNPCGSGGSYRKKKKELGEDIFEVPLPSQSTWTMASSTPLYCSHCFYNEIISLEKSGRRLWHTSFDPDSNGTCGWLVTTEQNSKR